MYLFTCDLYVGFFLQAFEALRLTVERCFEVYTTCSLYFAVEMIATLAGCAICIFQPNDDFAKRSIERSLSF